MCPIIYSHDLLILQTMIVIVRIGNSGPPCIRTLQSPDPALAKYRFALTAIHPLSWIQRLHLIKIRERLTGLRRRNCPTSVRQHWQSTTLTAPCQRLSRTHPRSTAFTISAAQICNPKVRSNSSSGIGSASAPAGSNQHDPLPPLGLPFGGRPGPPTEPRHPDLQKLVHGIRGQGSDVLGGAQPAIA